MTDSMVLKDALIGTWKFVEVKLVDKEQKISYPYGKNPIGYLMYTQEGYMAASLAKSDRLKLGLPVAEIFNLGYGAKINWTTGVFKYIKAFFRYFQAGQNYAAYIGKYEIIDNQVIHHLEVHIIPDVIGADIKQTVEISENTFVLTRESGIRATLKRVT
ncbi:MAG: lipocalin-like domain-containing protein [Roseofilum sp. SBFL]|uniref:lipocalin-like domain-containing protein n=1 Tax=unclassified Roseofilum TaxID=2620099 RepID=UPI001B12C652|nr:MULTISPECIES: lipocalin-like domain-containing protein [unclassified Roseofilum]MBP0013903.1 lipocalin-like domain-containing protein [Roseofilum sp. SID3]MBP0039587.1 lipocalin-like domain-containing protein [Roseofilum sp. SID1]MBP0043062.1 lipocalin-like domain-containing protein [Roseofilum sp. SBFL]